MKSHFRFWRLKIDCIKKFEDSNKLIKGNSVRLIEGLFSFVMVYFWHPLFYDDLCLVKVFLSGCRFGILDVRLTEKVIKNFYQFIVGSVVYCENVYKGLIRRVPYTVIQLWESILYVKTECITVHKFKVT